nr:M28 family peptidase [Gemmatimonadota bacterium]
MTDLRLFHLFPFRRRAASLRLCLRAALAGLSAFAGLAACVPAGTSIPPAPATVDSARLLSRVGVLAADSMMGRRVATEGSARARRYLIGELERLGVEPVGGAYEHPFVFSPTRGGETVPAEGVNLLARVQGRRDPSRVIVITAHYDHVGIGRAVGGDSIYNGADDNASGVATLLALAEYFQEHPPEHTLIFAALDAEETGLRGAHAFLEAALVPRESIALNINLDMVGHSESGELYAAGAAHTPSLRAILERVSARAPIRL